MVITFSSIARFLRSHLYDELNEQVQKWYIYYTLWQENLAVGDVSGEYYYSRNI